MLLVADADDGSVDCKRLRKDEEATNGDQQLEVLLTQHFHLRKVPAYVKALVDEHA